MSTNTPFHQDNATPPPPPPYETLKPGPPRTPVPIWAWGLGALLLGLLIALIVLLGGRDSEPQAAPAPVATVSAAPTAEASPSPSPSTKAKASPPASGQTRTPVAMSESEFLDFLHTQFPVLNTLSDAEIMAYSDETCDALDDGATPEDVMVTAVMNSSTPEEAEALGGIVGASVSNYCTEYYGDFTQFLNEQGVAVES